MERLSKLSLARRWDNWRPSRVRVRRPIPAPPSEPTPAELGALQALLDRSTRTATPTIADSVAYPARQMSAAEFVEFWRSVRLVAMATVGPAGQPHIAPVHAELAGTTLRLVVYEKAVRRQDLAANPRVAFTTWRADGSVAILYGRAREVPGSLRGARPGQSGRPRRVVTVEVPLTRIYAMRAPERQENVTAQEWIRLSDPALVADLGQFFREWGCITTEASGDTIQVLLPGAPSERQAGLEIRTCLGAWLSRHPGVEAEIIASELRS